jgi:glutaredoxin
MFTGNDCPYCDMAKEALLKMSLKFDTRNLDEEPLDQLIEKQLNNICGFTTIPKIFVGEQCIGGGSDLLELIKSGEFVELLKEENIL